jgi:pimeloyl-ACP methyl ester carboxylesterase
VGGRSTWRGYLASGVGQLHYRAAGGEGPAVVLFNQYNNSSRMWEAALPALGATCRAVAVDLPGTGMSDPFPQQPSLKDLARVAGDALDGLGFDRAVFGGFRSGAAVAAAHAAISPARTEGLVLIGFPLFDAETRARWQKEMATDPTAPDEEGRFLAELWSFYSVHEPVIRSREVVDRLLGGRKASELSLAILAEDLGAWLAEVRCPVLLICGAGDFCAPYQPEVLERLPDTRLVTLDGGPLVADEHPEELASLIAGFSVTAGGSITDGASTTDGVSAADGAAP